MISPLTFVTLLLAVLSGLYLYQAKHRAEVLDRQIARTLAQVAAARERIGLQRAEWALLAEPTRLGTIARQHLSLRPLAASQYVALPDLGSRLTPYPELGAPSWPISADVQGLAATRGRHTVPRDRLPGMARPSRPQKARVTAFQHLRVRDNGTVAASRLAAGM